jgi:hypothetical protein
MRSGAPFGVVRTVPIKPQPSTEQLSLGDGWNHVLRGRVDKAQPASPLSPTPTEVTVAPKKAPETSICKKARIKKPAPKVSAAPKKVPIKKSLCSQTHAALTAGASAHS